MWFAFKCIFWLGLTFNAMDWPVDAAPRDTLAGLARDVGGRITPHAAAEAAANVCLADARDCLPIAERASWRHRTAQPRAAAPRATPGGGARAAPSPAGAAPLVRL